MKSSTAHLTPEQKARETIDAALGLAGWAVQSWEEVNLSAARGVAVREFRLKHGFGYADYLLFVDGQAAGVIEAKKVGATLRGVEIQAESYRRGLPDDIPALVRPLPFLYQSTGVETLFTNRLDPAPRSREIFHFHRPETLAAWLDAEPMAVVPPRAGKKKARALEASDRPSTLRGRLCAMPSLDERGLWKVQAQAVRNLETSFADNRPRALVQMATGSGKTFTAVTSAYRLIKFGGAERILFLVDRANLGRQALREFQQYTAPDDGRKFTELYNVQHLTSNRLDPVAKVVITTIQRLYSMLRGEPELDPASEEASQFAEDEPLVREPVPVGYNPAIPVEFFDVVFIDECHRSIYSLWRQVLDYFDAFHVGLTATPSKQSYGFFRGNRVMQYSHEEAVADGVNVDFDVYRIRTRITERGNTIEAGVWDVVQKRDRLTRQKRWEKLDDDLKYDPSDLDGKVVAKDQIRTIVRAFRERLFTEIFPGRADVPKTLIYAKDDAHAEDIVEIVREEFARGNDFCWKITYRTTGAKTEDLIASFRNSYNPRIAVTVDMIATGTDIKPLEIVMFMRAVKSRNFFEQMKGRGVRVIGADDFRAVTEDPKATAKDHFVIVDCVGVCEQDLHESEPLERSRTVPFDKLLDAVGVGNVNEDALASLAGRLARLERRLGKPEREAIAAVSGGATLRGIAAGIVSAIDYDNQVAEARRANGLGPEEEPTPAQVKKAATALLKAAAAPLAHNPALRAQLKAIQHAHEQTIDEGDDELLYAGKSETAKDKAKQVVDSFEQFVKEHKDEYTALKLLYSRPHRSRLQYDDVRRLAKAIEAPPRAWTPQKLWEAYEQLGRAKDKSAGTKRMLTDIVSLVRVALHQDESLVPYKERVFERYRNWLAQQDNRGRRFTDEQRRWLDRIAEHVAASLGIEMEDFDRVPFNQHGGLGKVYEVFGDGLEKVLKEMNEELVA